MPTPAPPRPSRQSARSRHASTSSPPAITAPSPTPSIFTDRRQDPRRFTPFHDDDDLIGLRAAEVGVNESIAPTGRRLHDGGAPCLVCPILGVLYAVTLGGLVFVGFTPAVPWRFLPYLAFAVAPFAIVVVATLIAVDRQPPPGRLVKLAAAAVGTAAVYAYGNSLVWIPAAIGLAIVVRQQIRHRARPLCLAFVTLLFGYASVWNSNYILGWLMRNRIEDATLQRADELLYGLWFGGTPAWAGLFPLVRNPTYYGVDGMHRWGRLRCDRRQSDEHRDLCKYAGQRIEKREK